MRAWPRSGQCSSSSTSAAGRSAVENGGADAPATHPVYGSDAHPVGPACHGAYGGERVSLGRPLAAGGNYDVERRVQDLALVRAPLLPRGALRVGRLSLATKGAHGNSSRRSGSAVTRTGGRIDITAARRCGRSSCCRCIQTSPTCRTGLILATCCSGRPVASSNGRWFASI